MTGPRLGDGRVAGVSVDASHVVLLTGATGFVGKVVLEELMRRRAELGIGRVLALVRASDAEHASARLRADVLASRCFEAHAAGWEQRVEALAGDVTRAGLGLAPAARARVAAEVTHVIHCAASVEFNLPLVEASVVNTSGALSALEIARECRRLASFVDVSTAYVAAHPDARAGATLRVEEELAPLPRDPASLYADILAGRGAQERLLRETGHPNTYTLTKCVAEHLVARRGEGLPITLLRPSIVSASERTPSVGWIDSAAAFAGFVAALGSGRLRVVAAKLGARIDVVPCDAVAHRIVEAAFAPPPRGELRIRHAVAGLGGALSLQLCRERITAYFAAHPVRGPGVGIRYVGGPGPGFALAHALHHELPALRDVVRATLARRPALAKAARQLLERQRAINRDFTYFTHATFDFQSSVPLDPPLDPAKYLDVVCQGVSENLLRRPRKRERARAKAS
jgi:thioester reductase-like protein